MCLSAKTETTEAGVEKVIISANPDNSITKKNPSDLIKKMNTHTLCFCQLIRNVGVGKSEAGSRKSMEKTEDIRFHQSKNVLYFNFSHVKYNILYFHMLSNVHYTQSIFSYISLLCE